MSTQSVIYTKQLTERGETNVLKVKKQINNNENRKEKGHIQKNCIGSIKMDKISKPGMIFDSMADELNITATILEKAEKTYNTLGNYLK